MTNFGVNEDEQNYEILIAIEHDPLREIVEEVLLESKQCFEVVEPEKLIDREYFDEHLFLLETGDLKRTREIARNIVKKWGHLHEWSTLQYDLNFIFFTEPDISEEQFLSLWAIVGWDATLICNYGNADLANTKAYLRRMIGTNSLINNRDSDESV